jgi:hypothetical protein
VRFRVRIAARGASSLPCSYRLHCSSLPLLAAALARAPHTHNFILNLRTVGSVMGRVPEGHPKKQHQKPKGPLVGAKPIAARPFDHTVPF